MNAQFVYTKQSAAPLAVQIDVLNTVTQVVIGGHVGRIVTPRLGPKHRSDPFHEILAPIGFDRGKLHLLTSNQGIVWGREVSSPSGDSRIAAFLFEFDLAESEALAIRQMESIESAFDTWFSTLRDWVEALTHQDLSAEHPRLVAKERSNFFWTWKLEHQWKILRPQSGVVVVSLNSGAQTITIETWQQAVRHANELSLPPESHLLLRDARFHFHRERFSHSVILAGIAAETCMKDQIFRLLTLNGSPTSFIERILRSPAGALTDYCKDLSIPLPNEMTQDLIQVRNKAIHKNAAIDRQQGSRALKVATDLVNSLDSLKA